LPLKLLLVIFINFPLPEWERKKERVNLLLSKHPPLPLPSREESLSFVAILKKRSVKVKTDQFFYVCI
jgi:hypothetical protein